MEVKRCCRGTKLINILILFFFVFLTIDGARIKIKVIVDNARVKATPEIVGRTLARVPLNTILDAEEKQGEWYKVNMVQDGAQISGYIYQEYVKEVKEEELTQKEVGIKLEPARAQIELEVGIKSKMDEAKSLIRQEKDVDKGIRTLRSLIAKVFRITDNDKQRELATEIFLWMGLGFTGQDDTFNAVQEFKNMFEIDHAYAKDITRNIIDDKVMGLIQQAEDIFEGKVLDYTLNIITDPRGAMVKINGVEKETTPLTYGVKSDVGPPKFILEIEKEGYKSIKEEILLTQPVTEKTYKLESLGRDLEIISIPQGANVYLDDKDTEKLTNCTITRVPTGPHKLRIIKDHYNDWEEEIEIEAGEDTFRIEVELTAKEYITVSKYGGPSQTVFQLPKAIALDKSNNIYIADGSKTRIKKMNSEFQPQTAWGGGGREFRYLKDASGIAVDSNGFLYVTDSRSHNVMKFDRNGKFVTKWGKQGMEDEAFNNPLGIAADSENDIYVIDSRNHRIKKYANNGRLKKIFGKRGNEEGAFYFPSAIAVNQSDEVFVIDRNRLQKFSSEGEFIAAWGKPGTGDGEFNYAMGIYIDQKNFIYVADSNNNRIQKFDENGSFITKWGSVGSGDGQFNFPAGIAIDSRGYVFVIERDNNRIQAFRIKSE